MPNLQESLQVLNFFRAVGAVKERKEEARKTAAFESHKYAAEQYRKKREFILTKSIDYMDGLKEGPSKDLARARFKDHIGSWEPWEREAFAPYIQKVFSPDQEKKAEFARTWGDRPVVDKEAATDPLGYGQQVLAGKRYDWQFTKFMGGDPGDYDEYAPVDKETYLLHKQGDRPRLISLLDETITAMATSLPGSPTGEALVAAGGRWRTKEPSFIDAGADRYMITPMKDHFSKEGNIWTETQKVFTDPTKDIQPTPVLAVEFAALLDVDEDKFDLKSPAAGYMLSFKKRTDKGEDPDVVLEETIGRATGWTYRWFPKAIVVDWGYDYKGGTIAAVPGDEVQFPAKDPDSVYTMYHDKKTGWYYGSDMRAHGRSLEQALSWAATQEGVSIK